MITDNRPACLSKHHIGKTTIGLIVCFLTALVLGALAVPAQADGGGWPTATPTATRQAIVPLVVTPLPGKDVLPATPTSEVQGAAPLPENRSILPAESFQADQENAAPAPPNEAVQSGGISLRLVGIAVGIIAGLLLLVFLFLRLRA